MLGPLYFILLVLGCMVLQSTAVNFVAVKNIKPDLVLILIILNGFLRGTRQGAFLGFVGGVLMDIAGGEYFGVYALTGMTAGFLAGLGEGRLYRESRFIASGLTFTCTFFAQLVFYMLLALVGVRIHVVNAVAGIIIPGAVYNALVVLLLYGFYYRWHRRRVLDNEEY